MRYVDGYLSRRVQEVWPDAIVYRDEDGDQKRYVLERERAEPLGLGTNFREAKMAIEALRHRKPPRKPEAQEGST